MKVQLQHNGRKISYNIAGSGKTIVLLHGFLESQKIWEPFAAQLCKSFKVITIDLPGHGDTEVFGETHSMEFMAAMVKSILDTQNIEKAILVGHSMGGYVSFAFAKQFPERVHGLVIFHSHAAADTEEAKMNRSRTIQVVEDNRIGFIKNFIPDLFAPENTESLKDQIELLKAQAEQTPKAGIIAALKGMKERSDNTALLDEIKSPVLFIIGKKDKRISISQVMEQATAPAHCEVLLLDGVGHMGYLEAPRLTLTTIADFCRKI